MPGPITKVMYFPHKAFLKEASDIEDLAREVHVEDHAQVATLLERVKAFRDVLKHHESAEERFYFPPLETKFRHAVPTYVFDHNHHATTFEGIIESLTALASARFHGERVEVARRLHRQAIAMNVTTALHISKEDELLFPAFNDHFSDEEQAAIVAHQITNTEATVGGTTLVFRALTSEDREALLRGLLQGVPPEGLGHMLKLFSDAVSPQEWSEVVRRIPELAGAGITSPKVP